MDIELIALIDPFMKVDDQDPLVDYTIVDTTMKVEGLLMEPVYSFKAYYRGTSTLVDIERRRVLKVDSVYQRIKGLILALQKNFLQLFDLIIE